MTSGEVVERRPVLLVSLVSLILAAVLLPPGPFRIFAIALVLAVPVDLLISALLTHRVAIRVDLPPLVDLGVPTDVACEVVAPSRHIGHLQFVDGLCSQTFDPAGDSRVAVEAMQRGVHPVIHMQMVTRSLLSFAGLTHTVALRPDRPVVVVPAAIPDLALADRIDAFIHSGSEPDLTGVRPYREGDRRSDVHWTSTARVGRTMVRDRTKPDPGEQHLTIAVTETSADGLDRALGLARFAVERALARGLSIELALIGPDGPTLVPVDRQSPWVQLLAVAKPGAADLAAHPGAPAISIGQQGLR